MTRKQEETKRIKETLKGLSYRTKIWHSGGGWIRIYVPMPIWLKEKARVEVIVTKIVGRNQVTIHGYE